MAKIISANEQSQVKKTVKLTVVFEYELIDGQFQNADDEAHYNKYAEYLAPVETEEN